MEKMVWIAVYKDSTGLFTEESCDIDNVTYARLPERILKEWFYDNEYDKSFESFEKWFNEESDCDGTDGLYQYSIAKGFTPIVEGGVKMTIERNGKQIELTADEIYAAHEEWQRQADVEELGFWLDAISDDLEIEPEVMEAINLEDYADMYRDRLDNNDYLNERINEFTEDFVREVIVRDYE